MRTRDPDPNSADLGLVRDVVRLHFNHEHGPERTHESKPTQAHDCTHEPQAALADRTSWPVSNHNTGQFSLRFKHF